MLFLTKSLNRSGTDLQFRLILKIVQCFMAPTTVSSTRINTSKPGTSGGLLFASPWLRTPLITAAKPH